MLTALIYAIGSVLLICILTIATVVVLPLIALHCEQNEKED